MNNTGVRRFRVDLRRRRRALLRRLPRPLVRRLRFAKWAVTGPPPAKAPVKAPVKPAGEAPAKRPAKKPAKAAAKPPSIFDAYVSGVPTAQKAVDVFVGEWASQLPESWQATGGTAPLFADARIAWALERFGDVTDWRVLELGPLEGGHSHMLTTAGADVLAIEANSRAFLKCLIAKELSGMRARFLLGDFVEYLRTTDERFDLCLASGVLYHMRDPIELLALTAKVADRLFLWTHVYDADVLSQRDDFATRYPKAVPTETEGFAHTLHRHMYGNVPPGFCGGSEPYSNWISRDDLLKGLAHFGWNVDGIAFDDPGHLNGPALALVASRR